MEAFASGQLEIVERHLVTLEHDYESESSRREAKELLENIRAQNERMLELLTSM